MALTVKGIERLKPKLKPDRKTGRKKFVGFKVRDKETRGLYLQVGPTGTKSWLFRFELNGRERFMGLGPFPVFSLKQARERANAARQKLTDGIDPLEQKRTDRAAAAAEAAKNVTFAACASLYYEAHEASWSNAKHRQQFLNTLRDHVIPIIGALPVAAVDEPQVLKVLTPIWKTKTVTASRVRNRIAAVLDFAAAAGYRKGTNPARWEGHLEFLLGAPEKLARAKHHAALPYPEIATFLAELRAVDGVPARALDILILTATRTGEVLRARWDEIDFKTKTWTIPAARMKNKVEHRVPLSDRVLEILQALPPKDGNDFVFIGPRGAGTSISTVALLRCLRRLRSDATVHGFRSSFSTWAHETTGHANHTIEQSLAHTVGTAVERAYRRGDLFAKRARLMADWARYCATKPAQAADNVTPLRRA